MLANATDIFRAQLRTRESADGAFIPERRKRPRTSVHWPVRLLKEGAVSGIHTTTHNLSSSGFYCLSATPLLPGESLLCILTVPAYDPRSQERTITLECRALVMRAEATPDGLFGIACRIEDYHLAGQDAAGA
jgi:PilZ domain